MSLNSEVPYNTVTGISSKIVILFSISLLQVKFEKHVFICIHQNESETVAAIFDRIH